MLSNAYFLAKFRFDTAENEPAKNLQNFRKMHFSKMHFSKMHFRNPSADRAAAAAEDPRASAAGSGGAGSPRSGARCRPAPELAIFMIAF